MPLSKVSYPYANNTLYVPQLLTNTFNTSGGAIFSGTIDENSIVPGIHIGIQNSTPRIMFSPLNSTSSASNWQIDVNAGVFRWFTPNVTQMTLSDGRLAVGSTILADATIYGLIQDPSRKGLVIKGAASQSADLIQAQNSAGSSLLSLSPTVLTSNVGVNIFAGDVRVGTSNYFTSALSVLARTTTEVGAVIRGASGQTADLLQIQNNTPTTLVSISSGGNYSATFANPRVTLNNNSGTSTSTQLGADSGAGYVGTTTSNTFAIVTNNTTRMTFASDGTMSTFSTPVTIDGNLTVNGTTTTINSSTLSVDDKNIEMGAVVAATVSTTGTVGSITGTGPWTATITGMTDTADLIVGSTILATNGTGSLGGGGVNTITSIVSATSVTYTASGGTTPVAGTVTNITTTGATDVTANGGGIVLKGATDKSILWDSTNSNWTSTEHFNLASTKVFKINNSQVLSATAVLGITPTTNATGFTLSGGTTAVAVTFAGGAAYTLSGTNGQTYTFPSATGTLITASSPTITTPVIDTINASAATATTSLHPTVTTGSIAIGAGLTTGALNIATVGTGVTPISIGHTNATLAITTSGTTLTTAGALTLASTLQATTGTFTGSTLAINGATPTISSTNASAASIFTATVTGVTIGSSTIKTTEYPSDPSGTTSGTVTQSAQLNGYKGMPINPRGAAGVALAYTLTASDAGRMIYVSSTPTTPTITIPANSAVAFEIGTTIVVMNDIGAATNVSIAITTDTLQLVSTGATGTRTLARYGMATLVKVTATKWIITGNGLT